MKAYTDIPQSKTLSKILPIESADMFYCYNMDIKTKEWSYDETPTIEDESYKRDIGDIPCWSLAALLGVLPEETRLLKSTNISSVGDTKYHCDCPKGNIDEWFDNPVDACVAMIEKLHELKLL